MFTTLMRVIAGPRPLSAGQTGFAKPVIPKTQGVGLAPEHTSFTVAEHRFDSRRGKTIPGTPHRLVAKSRNLVVPAEGVRPLDDVLKQDPHFRGLHTIDGVVDFDRPLSHERQLQVIKHITGVTLFDGKDPRHDLARDDILSVAAFLGEQTVANDGEDYIVQMTQAAWSSVFIDRQKGPMTVESDCDDTLVHAWHVDEISRQAARSAVGHFIFKRSGGGYSFQTQMKPKVFAIFYRLRHGTGFNIVTDADRYAQLNHARDFPNYRFAIYGLLPYQNPDAAAIHANAAQVFTTREHAAKIHLLADYVERLGARDQTPVFERLSPELKWTVADLLFAKQRGHKSYKKKNPVLRRLDASGELVGGAAVMIDNNEISGEAGMMTGMQSFIHIEDRPPGLANQIRYYGSTAIYEGLQSWVSKNGQRLARRVPSNDLSAVVYGSVNGLVALLGDRGTLNTLPARNYSEEPVALALQIVAGHDQATFIDLNSRDLSRGVSGLVIQRTRTAMPYAQFIRGTEKEWRDAKLAIKRLRRIFAKLNELRAIRSYYRS